MDWREEKRYGKSRQPRFVPGVGWIQEMQRRRRLELRRMKVGKKVLRDF